MSFNYIRHIELEILVDNEVIRIPSDGSRNTLGIDFYIYKTLVGLPDESQVKIYNCSPEFIQRIVPPRKDFVKINIYAGYLNAGYTGSNVPNKTTHMVGSGLAVRIIPERNGVNNSVTISLLDNFDVLLLSDISKTYAPNTAVKDVVLDLVSGFKGVIVDERAIMIDGVIGQKEFVAFGKISKVLDDLAKQYNFSWHIFSGTFTATKDNQRNPQARNFSVSYKKKNLLKATPILGTGYQQIIGMKIQAMLEPTCRAGDVIDLESEFFPQYNSSYLIHTLEMTGSTQSKDWKMAINSLNIAKIQSWTPASSKPTTPFSSQS